MCEPIDAMLTESETATVVAALQLALDLHGGDSPEGGLFLEALSAMGVAPYEWTVDEPVLEPVEVARRMLTGAQH